MKIARYWVVVASVLLLALPWIGIGSSAAQGESTVSLEPVTVGVGETALLNGRIICAASGCGGFKLTINFDRNMLRINRAIIGPYLGGSVFEAENTVDNAAGQVRLVAAAMSPPPAGADTILFQLEVGGLLPGIAMLDFAQLEITDLDGNPVPSSGQGANVTVVETGKIAFFSPPSNNWEVAFVSERDGNPEIYAMAADGSNVRRLTDNPALDDEPTWSPDGSQIAFFSQRDGNAEVYVMAADGSSVRRLTDNPADDSFPAWSPDGSQIAFTSTRDGNQEIYAMNADGSNVRRLTNDPAGDAYPAWSPDGGQVAFVSTRDGAAEIYMMNPDGSNVTRVTNLFGANGWYPAWSPNGMLLSLSTERDGAADLYIMDWQGTNPRRLTERSDRVTSSDWSPDGQWIAYMASYTDNADLYVTDINGSYIFRLTDNPAEDYAPDWRPLGTAPCIVRTDREEVEVRVGPGENRSVFTTLPSNQDFRVIGQALDGQGNIWYELDKDQIPGSEMANSLWVKAADIQTSGDCGATPRVEAPPIIPGGPPPGQPTPSTGYGPCGSCDTCGHPGECITTPDGQCVWDPATCHEPDDHPGDGCYTLSLSVEPTSPVAGPPGSITPRPGPNCPTGGGYLPGTSVTLVASPNSGWQFSYWSGSCPGAGGTSNLITITMNSSCSAVAHFVH